MNSSHLSKKKLLEIRIKEATTDNIITCAALMKIADKVGASYKEAGNAADRLKIKIRNCQLGCF